MLSFNKFSKISNLFVKVFTAVDFDLSVYISTMILDDLLILIMKYIL